jgi:YfiH family protein
MKLPEPFEAHGEHIGIALPGAHALFTTRRGGVSRGPFASLNLGRWTDDEPDAVERNRQLLAEQLQLRYAYGRQVHGSHVTRVQAMPTADGAEVPAEADGQATTLRGVGPMVLSADCLPIALATPGAVAMIHAGWRGLAAGVIAEGARALEELVGRMPQAAAIGPGAGPCCYEVGDEVRGVFGAGGGRTLDLKGIAGAQLERLGVEQVHDCGLCTICSDPELFFSHRRDKGVTGRQAGIAWLT